MDTSWHSRQVLEWTHDWDDGSLDICLVEQEESVHEVGEAMHNVCCTSAESLHDCHDRIVEYVRIGEHDHGHRCL